MLPDWWGAARRRLLHSIKCLWAELLPTGAAVLEQQHLLQCAEHLRGQHLLPSRSAVSGELNLLQCGAGRWLYI